MGFEGYVHYLLLKNNAWVIPFLKSSYLMAIMGTVTVIAFPIDSCLNSIATYKDIGKSKTSLIYFGM